MSAFVVISVKENLNWIVDGIKDCRPHNPDVVTRLSTGKIKKEEENKYLYEYTTFSKHAGDDGTDEALSRTVESDIPRNLFSNQIAQFLNVCENEGEQINIFLIDNPITDADFERTSWLIDEIRAVYDSHKATNFQLIRVLFSYDVDKPTDVNRQVSKMILRQIASINLNDSDDFLSKILYIDNQNRSGAAMCLNKAEHDIMIPRMLCDFMMLLSNKDDSYNVSAAIGGQNSMFSVGYSECMYYHDDVFRYYDLAGRRDLLNYMLETADSEESMDFNLHPIGLEDRQRRLAPVYEEVPYNIPVEVHPGSIDKAIDDIVISLKEDIIRIKQEALSAAAEKDAAATKSKLIEHLKDNGLIHNDMGEEELANGYMSIAEENNVDIGRFSVTTATEQAKKDYPEYIDRHQIYEEYLVEDAEKEDFEGTDLKENISAYNELIRFIQTGRFKRYVRCQCESNDNGAVTPGSSEPTTKNPCLWKRLLDFLKRLFIRKGEFENIQEVKAAESPRRPTVTRDWHLLRDSIASISEMYAKRKDYFRLKEKIKSIRDEVDVLSNDIHNFRLTVHCSSVDNLIDLDKLKAFHQSGRDARLSKIVERWSRRDEDKKTYDALFEELKEKTKWDLFSFYYIDWSEPFDFIKDIDLPKVCEALKRKSQPFVNTYTLESNAENLTSYIFYTDNERWHEDISQKRVTLKDDNKVSSTFSRHICSKICMFQFLQMSQELIAGLVDCQEN